MKDPTVGRQRAVNAQSMEAPASEPSRRSALQGLLALAWAGLGAGRSAATERPADAAAWPIKPVTLIVPWPAGGGTDLTVRVLAEEASARLGQPVIVANRPGAAGTMVAPLLKAALADGHTIGQLPVTVFRHALMNRVAWNPVTDLAPILQVSGTTFGLLVPASSHWRTVADLLEWAAAHPGELLLGSTGIGSTPHLAMEELLLDHGIRYTHVPYKGTADQMLALASGAIMAGMNSTGFAPWVEQGKLRLLALTGERRSQRWPAVPTLRELGFRHAVHHSPWGLAAPAATPAVAIEILHQAFRQALFTPRHLAELERYDQEAAYLGPADYRLALAGTVARERRLLERMQLLADPVPRAKGEA
jgi:tripartite-type tricarboxylate transporter receptor subunit TctC